MAKEPALAITGGEICDLLNPDLLETHIRNKVVKRQSHPTLPLAILNYTQKATFEQLWDSVTIRCRGFIYNFENGDLVSVPFAKFFNYDTADREETFPENLPTSEPEITQKLDGSLGIYWFFDGHQGIATRGSFLSEQAKWATKWLEQNANQVGLSNIIGGKQQLTPLFEIIYPENQVVVKYSHSGLTLIGCVDNKTGEELNYKELTALGNGIGVPVVEQISGVDLEELTLIDVENEEGFVATWHLPEGPPLRVKIKFPTYFRLHRLLTGTSPKRIWEYLKDGKPLSELLDEVPDHFVKWVNDWGQKLSKEFFSIEAEALKRFEAVGKFILVRKDFALWANQPENKKYAPILFKMLDGHPYHEMLWKIVKTLTKDLGTFKTVDE